ISNITSFASGKIKNPLRFYSCRNQITLQHNAVLKFDYYYSIVNSMKRTLKTFIASFGILTLLSFTTAAITHAQDVVPVEPVPQTTIGDKVCQGLLFTETGQRNRNATVSSCGETGEQSFAGLTRR